MNKIFTSALLTLFLAFFCHAGELEAFATQRENNIEIEIVNTSKQVVVVVDPTWEMVVLDGKTDKFPRGIGLPHSSGGNPWKQLIFLSPKSKEKSDQSSYRFLVKFDRGKKGTFREMQIMMQFITEKDYRNRIGASSMLPLFKYATMQVTISEPRDTASEVHNESPKHEDDHKGKNGEHSDRATHQDVKVFARQADDSITFWIENASETRIVYLGTPELSGITIMARSNKFEGKLKSSIPMATHPGKHVTILTGKQEDMPHRWMHKLTVKADRMEIGDLTNLRIVMWALPGREYAGIVEKGGSIIPKLRMIEIVAEIMAAP